MRKLILHSILLLSVFSISSCNYLDVDKWFDDTMKYDSIFSRKEYLERYMWNVASMFPDEGDFLNSPATAGPLATDEAFETFNAETYTGMAYVTGAINEENITNNAAIIYAQRISHTNIILLKIVLFLELPIAEAVFRINLMRFLQS